LGGVESGEVPGRKMIKESSVLREEWASRDGLIVREDEPPNLEMPFETLDGFTTPNDSFYVRCHFPIPQIAERDWALSVEGAVENPFQLNYGELRKMESRTIPVTLECAGNNRIFLEPKVKGVQWGLGAVGNAVWKGVPLSVLLARAKTKANAAEIILEGVDAGPVDKTPRPAGDIHFARSLPLRKAMDDVLLAYEMNGERLTAAHGFPLRAIVPGWYAMASVKWLGRIIVTEQPFAGYYQSIDYAYWERRGDLATLVPITSMQVKAEVAWPAAGDVVPKSSTVRVHGAAWTSGAEITEVELSFDGGAAWKKAQLLGEHAENAWRLWQFDWRTPEQSGKHTLVARATDSLGHTQPLVHNRDHGTYMINHWLPIEVEVR
jgi:DMSO/TMAO reductase YedYZ molybdopterin-dependent catalytic subunit